MKNYIITNKKGEKTRVIADSLDDAIQIYNKKYTKDSIYIYQFPSFTDEDLKESKKYNLTLVNKTNNGNAKLKGELKDLKRFAKEYLDYQLVEKYLIKDAIEINNDSIVVKDSHYLESNKQYMNKLWNNKNMYERKYKVKITRQGEGNYIEGQRKNIILLLKEMYGNDFNPEPFIHD